MEQQYIDLYQEDCRVKDSNYYKLGLNINNEVFEQLNFKTNKSGVDVNDLENIVRNYEDDIISIKELIDSLYVFGRKIEDFGINEEVEEEDLQDISKNKKTP